MGIKKLGLLIFLSLMSLALFSQEELSNKQLLKSYQEALQLSQEQHQKLKETISKYRLIHSDKKISRVEHNRMVKRRHLEVMTYLDERQMIKYRELLKKLEPELSYRFK